MVYIEHYFSPEKWLEKYPDAKIVPNETFLWTLAPGIREALHDVRAPQSGENWRIISNGYYHSVVEVW
jgi:hypothetical protein